MARGDIIMVSEPLAILNSSNATQRASAQDLTDLILADPGKRSSKWLDALYDGSSKSAQAIMSLEAADAIWRSPAMDAPAASSREHASGSKATAAAGFAAPKGGRAAPSKARVSADKKQEKRISNVVKYNVRVRRQLCAVLPAGGASELLLPSDQ